MRALRRWLGALLDRVIELAWRARLALTMPPSPAMVLLNEMDADMQRRLAEHLALESAWRGVAAKTINAPLAIPTRRA